MLEFFLSLLILTGATLTFIGSLGLVRLKDLYTRLHGPTKATTLGVGCLLIASAVYFSTTDENISLHEILITLFLFITAPVSAHLIAKASLHLSLPSIAKAPETNDNNQETPDKTAEDTSNSSTDEDIEPAEPELPKNTTRSPEQ
ncbi:Na+/H+ antiporter subunit G [Nitrosomonas marina]|uniref:Multisubunit potassium/proton antiporter, PhaG subunit n=1 Tax=Nitrosomonas marina TaxID=917 RepID=A0A1H8G512_9PROT|nr:Na+/H+ antiporter subunit G [Nitrosomonas marina]SEN39106.1 multisubunit potassium/proton antiporter, PhaG subunit [Nitrosomonas marina]